MGNSIETACELAELPKSTWYYQPQGNDLNKAITERLKELAQERPRFGSPRLTIFIRNEFGAVNHKRVELLYRAAGLNLPKKRRKRKWAGLATGNADSRWSGTTLVNGFHVR